MKKRIAAVIILTCMFISAAVLEKYNFSKSDFVYELDMGLNEISGLTVSSDGRLFANNDEIGSIFELDPKNGRIIKWFWLGPNKVYEDFEAVALVDQTFYLITSSGIIYKFYDQPDGKYSQYDKIRTGFTGSFDIEGMCYDPKTNSLLIASKSFAGKGYKNSRAVYSFDLKTEKVSEKPRFIFDLDDLKKKYKIKNFSPSSIERDPDSGNFLILSSDDRGVLEVSPSGKTLNFQELKKDDHPQPEGITILNKTLIISDEGSGKKAKITGYKLK